MSISSIAMIMERIAQASPDSRIAVFIADAGLDSVFADTLTGQKRIWQDHLALLEIWHSGSNQYEIRDKLEPYRQDRESRPRPRGLKGREVPYVGEGFSGYKFTGEL